MNKESSYTSANSIPYKLVKDADVFREAADYKSVPLVHLQISPTNNCNLNCPWCSCSDRNKQEELDSADLTSIIETSDSLGVKSFTITGGGEPLLHPAINEFIDDAVAAGIKVGLVTNGVTLKEATLVNGVNLHTLRNLTWCRVSFGDHRKFEGDFENNIRWAVEEAKLVDWAFSYVVSEKVNPDNIYKIVNLANELDFTHVRMVADIYNPDKIDMQIVKNILKNTSVDDAKVIYQPRQSFTKGAKNCWISLLKPIIAADGWVYPCCGVQYALADSKRDFVKSMRICHHSELERFLEKQKPFDGSVCAKCYYADYNDTLNNMLKDLDHGEFV